MIAEEIKQLFLDYFKQAGHTIVPSSPLAPQNDPTLLFTNAGMVQFKQVFLGQSRRAYHKAASAQKCIRAGGKHNDLENVGHTARHHTFFEMLGNFSFGDYFKEQAIELAWEFLVQKLHLPPDKLWVTVYQDDDEASRLWRERIGVPSERIARFGEKDNFWSMGDIGPCGPCSEVMIDQGAEVGCGRESCRIGCDCDRYLELWNLVFMQFERDSAGKITPLPKPSIDTGMGLERITAVVQGVRSNFESDLFTPIIKATTELAEFDPPGYQDYKPSLNVIADHIRALTFIIADGVMPSNEGRGYVMRRILRRAARHGKKLGLQKPYLYRLSGTVVDLMRSGYPELEDNRLFAAKVIKLEEERFSDTLNQGLGILEEVIAEAREKGLRAVGGDKVFRLYDTHGFPLDLTREILEENELSLDEQGFEAAMQAQKDQSRAARVDVGPSQILPAYQELANSGITTVTSGCEEFPPQFKPEGLAQGKSLEDFPRYSNILGIIQRGRLAEEAKEIGQPVELVIKETCFYAEKGGQVTDTGQIKNDRGAALQVTIVKEVRSGLVVHVGTLKQGSFRLGDEVKLYVDWGRRLSIARNHTATHLLQAALRRVLGEHVRQAGSLVAPDRLRFDFTHLSALSDRELARAEELVNEYIWDNYPVSTTQTSLKEALQRGVIALFEDKYEDRVRLVAIGRNAASVSAELCGGTHVGATGNIGWFKIGSESGVAAGIRRIEAYTGQGAYRYLKQKEDTLAEISSILKAPVSETVTRLEQLLHTSKEQEREIERLQAYQVKAEAEGILGDVQEVCGVKILAATVSSRSTEQLRMLGDNLRDRLGSGAVVLGMEAGGKAVFLAMVTKDLISRLPANKLAARAAKLAGGGGGGRPDIAQAGGKYPEKIKDAINQSPRIAREMLTAE